MIYIAIVISLLFLALAINTKKLNMIVFNLVWIASLAINSVCYDVIDEPSEKASLFILLFVFSVNIGALVTRRVSGISFHGSNTTEVDYSVNIKKFLVLNLAVTVYFVFKYTVKSYRITSEYGLIFTRIYAYTSDEAYFGSTLDLYIAQHIIYAFFYSSMIIGITRMVKGGQKHGWINFIGILQMLLFSYTFKGRSAIISVILYLLAAVYIRFNKNSTNVDISQKRKIVKRIRPIVIFIGIYLVILSLSRFGGTSQLKKFFIIYFGGSVTYFSKLVDIAKIRYEPGFFSLCGIVDFFKLALSVVFGLKLDMGGNVIGSYIDGATNIGAGLSINAMCSAPFYFYLEFGIIGILVLGFFLGSISSMLQRRYSNRPSSINTVLYLLVLYTLFYTYSGWSLKYLYFWLVPFIIKLYSDKEFSSNN